MDITMCKGETCPLKETCLRYKGEPNSYSQWYYNYVPFKDNNCTEYYEIKEDTPLTEKEEWGLFFKHFSEIVKTGYNNSLL